MRKNPDGLKAFLEDAFHEVQGLRDTTMIIDNPLSEKDFVISYIMFLKSTQDESETFLCEFYEIYKE